MINEKGGEDLVSLNKPNTAVMHLDIVAGVLEGVSE